MTQRESSVSMQQAAVLTSNPTNGFSLGRKGFTMRERKPDCHSTSETVVNADNFG